MLKTSVRNACCPRVSVLANVQSFARSYFRGSKSAGVVEGNNQQLVLTNKGRGLTEIPLGFQWPGDIVRCDPGAGTEPCCVRPVSVLFGDDTNEWA